MTAIIEKYWDDAREGDQCISPEYIVTKERILAYADLTGKPTLDQITDELAPGRDEITLLTCSSISTLARP